MGYRIIDQYDIIYIFCIELDSIKAEYHPGHEHLETGKQKAIDGNCDLYVMRKTSSSLHKGGIPIFIKCQS
jgi:hypothetical protein